MRSGARDVSARCSFPLAADGRMLEDHVVLSELGDDWGPVIRLALWTRDRRPFRTRGWRIASERLLRDPCSV